MCPLEVKDTLRLDVRSFGPGYQSGRCSSQLSPETPGFVGTKLIISTKSIWILSNVCLKEKEREKDNNKVVAPFHTDLVLPLEPLPEWVLLSPRFHSWSTKVELLLASA